MVENATLKRQGQELTDPILAIFQIINYHLTSNRSMLSMIITGIVIALIIIIALVMHYMGAILSDMNDHFLSISALMLVFLIGAAVYLSYAVPSIASPNPYEQQSGDIKVYRDTPSKSLIEQITGE